MSDLSKIKALFTRPGQLLPRLWQRALLEPYLFRSGHVSLKERDLSTFTHMVSSREGLFAINRDRWCKVMAGQFFGMTVRDGAVYVFQALGPYRPPEGSTEPIYNRGRLLRLTIGDGHVTDAGTVYAGLSNGVHQIDFIDGVLFLVDTYNNRILEMNRDLDAVAHEYFPAGKARQEDWAGGYAHFNSILGREGDIYLLKHNGRPEKAVRNSEIIRCNRSFEVLETITLNGNACHNIVFLDDGGLLVCGSQLGELIDGERVLARISNHYTRGLSIDDENIVVGSSIYATRTGKHGRRYVPGKVMFFDRKLSLVSELELPAAPTDIRRIDGRDHGLSHPAIAPGDSRC